MLDCESFFAFRLLYFSYVRRRNAVFVTASSDPWHYFHAILVYGCDKVGGEVTVPDDTFADSVLLRGSAGLAVFWVIA